MKNVKIELKWALAYALMTVIWSLAAKLLGFHDSKISYGFVFNTLIIIPSIAVYVLAIREKKHKFYSGMMTYKEGFMTGVVLTVFATILGPVYPAFTAAISPGLFQNSIDFMVSTNAMTRADAEQQFTLTNFVIQGLFGSLVYGLVYTAIIALVLKTKNPVSQVTS